MASEDLVVIAVPTAIGRLLQRGIGEGQDEGIDQRIGDDNRHVENGRKKQDQAKMIVLRRTLFPSPSQPHGHAGLVEAGPEGPKIDDRSVSSRLVHGQRQYARFQLRSSGETGRGPPSRTSR